MSVEFKMPRNLKPYSTSPLFSCETVPKQLLKAHNLKKGRWGLLNVQKGKVKYFLAQQKSPLAILKANDQHVIETEILHFIELSIDAEFYIEFYK